MWQVRGCLICLFNKYLEFFVNVYQCSEIYSSIHTICLASFINRLTNTVSDELDGLACQTVKSAFPDVLEISWSKLNIANPVTFCTWQLYIMHKNVKLDPIADQKLTCNHKK